MPQPNVSLIIRHAGLALAAGLLACAAGCQSSLDRLDTEVTQLIEQRQALALGMTLPVEPETEADLAPNTPYDYNPGTVNPDLADLPATTETEGVVLDPDSALAAIASPAPDALRMDLVQILGYAIEHAPTYRNRKESLYLTVLSLVAERHLWGPRFFDTVTSRVTGTPERGDFDTAMTLVNEFGVTQRLPYGGSIGASALVNYVNYLQQETGSTEPRDSSSQELVLTLDLPLLRGAGQAAREDLIQSERDVVYAVRDFERFRREFLVDVANDYFDLVRQQRSLVNQRLQMQNLRRLADRTQALAEAGRIPPFDAENTAQQVLFSYNNLIEDEEDYLADLDTFKLQIGMATTRELVIVPQDIDVPTPRLDSAEAVVTAWDLRLDLQTAEDRVDDARRFVKVAENGTLPDLDLFARVSAVSDSGRRYGGSMQLDEGEYTAGATLSLPLDRKIEWTRVRRAQILLEQQKRSYQLSRDQVALQVRRSVRLIDQARTALTLQQRNVELAERRIQGLELREREIQPRDMIEAQEDLLEARDRLDAAEADLRSNILQYLLNTGQMRVAPDGQWLAPAQLTRLPESDPAAPTLEPPAGEQGT